MFVQKNGATDINCIGWMLRPFDSKIESQFASQFQNCDYAWQHRDARSTISGQSGLSAS
jgi:hypothetical protein